MSMQRPTRVGGGPVPLAVPRDRAGTVTPTLVPKGERRLGGPSDVIVSLYTGG
jgi:putative transposase